MHMEIILALFRISLWPFKDDPFFFQVYLLENWNNLGELVTIDFEK